MPLEMKFKTIAELLTAVQSGAIKEADLIIRLDNDCTSFYINDPTDTDNWGEEIEVEESNGYYDYEPLYKLLFPLADVDMV